MWLKHSFKRWTIQHMEDSHCPFQYKKCEQTFETEVYLKTHMTSDHLYPSEECEQLFEKGEYLVNHENCDHPTFKWFGQNK